MENKLKVSSATFLLVCFECLKESTCETRRNIFFNFKSSLRSWYNQILTFQIFKCHDFIKFLEAWNMKHILLNNLRSKQSLVIKFDQFMQYYKRIFFFKKSYKKCCHKLVPGPFYFHGIFCKKESKEVSVLIWTNFHSFANTYLI